MKRLPIKNIVEIMNGSIVQGMDNLIIDNIVIGTKRLKQDSLFFDLRRNRYNPNKYQKNWSFAVVTDKPAKFFGLSDNITIIRVPETIAAYWKFVDFYRNIFNIPVIGVTGTCGKTTTKEMIKHILAGTYKVNATYKSFNALFRNLSYLLEIDDQTQAAVYEMGVAFSGDLKTSCRYFKPQVGIITNIGVDHFQAFGSLDAYIKAKTELLEGMGFQGTLILNADDENINKIDLKKFRGNVIYFGFGDQSDFKVSNTVQEKETVKFIIRYRGKTYHFSFPGHGEFNVYNAAAAIAAAHAVGLTIEEAGARLGSFQNVEKHFEFNEGINRSTIIDDTWSTNPTSVEAALKLLKSLSEGKKTIAVLGKMSLLGDLSAKYHFQAGERVAELGIDQLIVIGEGADEIGLGALQKGMVQENVFFCKDSNETYAVLRKSLDENSIALVKTSMLASYSELMNKIIVKKILSRSK
ncbi:MAG: UDP-N-acetylmuramoyl-tripeptide--D-alanyl-D-alanine ligase [Bacillota bacterium]